MAPTFIDVHALQTVPPSNINRDASGRPKTAVFGGTKRARVSSQSWKAAIRKAFRDTDAANGYGIRTKHVPSVLADHIGTLAEGLMSREAAVELATNVVNTLGIQAKAPKAKKGEEPADPEVPYLVFLSTLQYKALAAIAYDAYVAAGENPVDLKPLKKQLRDAAAQSSSIDVALFGREIVENKTLSVDAACQFAHAISVDRIRSEADFYTAIDDIKAEEGESAGAGMMGDIYFNSSTLYRYANISVDKLIENLGDRAAALPAIEEFIRAFATTMPSGKVNTFGNATLPDALLVQVRSDQPINLSGAFTNAIDGDVAAEAVNALVNRAADLDETYGLAPDAAWVLALPEHRAAFDGHAKPATLNEIGQKAAVVALNNVGA